eukprot:TRINITY_DN11534_c0_g1_i2.p1 TRINITY_DN11534_c0_g1~~TRINITY_DN11534_c0_g1_i2.p1  ORF type:complete len:117 (+),score=11.82 TRINITY_DN11534_c0_g1_i2:86-436(+)
MQPALWVVILSVCLVSCVQAQCARPSWEACVKTLVRNAYDQGIATGGWSHHANLQRLWDSACTSSTRPALNDICQICWEGPSIQAKLTSVTNPDVAKKIMSMTYNGCFLPERGGEL